MKSFATIIRKAAKCFCKAFRLRCSLEPWLRRVALFSCCTFSLSHFFFVALFSFCTFLILKTLKWTKERKRNHKKRHYIQHPELVSLLSWYPVTHFYRYIVLNADKVKKNKFCWRRIYLLRLETFKTRMWVENCFFRYHATILIRAVCYYHVTYAFQSESSLAKSGWPQIFFS